jgi:hypothetical protein
MTNAVRRYARHVEPSSARDETELRAIEGLRRSAQVRKEQFLRKTDGPALGGARA